jgi:hypothetical protein
MVVTIENCVDTITFEIIRKQSHNIFFKASDMAMNYFLTINSQYLLVHFRFTSLKKIMYNILISKNHP